MAVAKLIKVGNRRHSGLGDNRDLGIVVFESESSLLQQVKNVPPIYRLWPFIHVPAAPDDH
jgi:hypothetical protein